MLCGGQVLFVSSSLIFLSVMQYSICFVVRSFEFFFFELCLQTMPRVHVHKLTGRMRVSHVSPATFPITLPFFFWVFFFFFQVPPVSDTLYVMWSFIAAITYTSIRFFSITYLSQRVIIIKCETTRSNLLIIKPVFYFCVVIYFVIFISAFFCSRWI